MSTAIQRIEVFQDTMNWIKTDIDLSDSEPQWGQVHGNVSEKN